MSTPTLRVHTCLCQQASKAVSFAQLLRGNSADSKQVNRAVASTLVGGVCGAL